jgi:hypothetical protein
LPACGGECIARVRSLLEALAIQSINRDQIGTIEATQALSCERLVAQLLASDIGADMDILQHLGPALSGPERTDNRHVAFNAAKPFPLRGAVGLENQIAQVCHGVPPVIVSNSNNKSNKKARALQGLRVQPCSSND